MGATCCGQTEKNRQMTGTLESARDIDILNDAGVCKHEIIGNVDTLHSPGGEEPINERSPEAEKQEFAYVDR